MTLTVISFVTKNESMFEKSTIYSFISGFILSLKYAFADFSKVRIHLVV